MKAKSQAIRNDGYISEGGITPPLRFPDFEYDGPWESKSLGSVLDYERPDKYIVAQAIYQGDGVPVLTANKSFILGYTHERLGIYDSVPVVIFDDFTTDAKYVPFPFKVKSSAIKILTSKGEDDLRFIFALMSNIRFKARDHKRYWISEYQNIKVPLPNSGEQKKIANCLRSIEELIAAESRKLSALKNYKKGLLQQLFPAEGETLPGLRFPEFHKDQEWELKELGTLVVLQSGGTPSKASPAFWDGSIPWVSAKDMKRLFLDDTEDHISMTAVDRGAKLVPPGTLLMLTRGMTLLKDVPICMLRREMSFNQDVKALRPKVDLNGLFLALALLKSKQRLLKMVDIAGHGTGKLNTDDLKAFEFAFPKLAEQQKIASFLSSVDQMLATQLRKLDSLAAHKKGLMQQLFPVLDEGQA